MKYFLVVFFEAICSLLFALPRFYFLNSVKKIPLKLVGAKFGKKTVFYPRVWIQPGMNLKVGDDVDFALGVVVTTKGGVTIGDRVLIGYRSQILSHNHQLPKDKGRIIDAGHDYKPVTIGDDAWIGANCIILPGVTIGEGAVVGAGSIVTKDIPAFSIAVGNPAKIIKRRDSHETNPPKYQQR